MNLNLEDKIVVITGGTGGIGSQIVADFLREKAIVICLIRNEEKMKKLTSDLESNAIRTSKLFSEQCNLLEYASIQTAIKKISKEHQRIDVLVNCAGSTEEYPFALLSEKQISDIIDLNLKSPMYVSQAVLRTMFRQNAGSIINISSVSAQKKGRGIVAYASAKAGIDAFTRGLAAEVGKKNIRVNAIRPGIINTNMSEAVMSRMKDEFLNLSSLGRFGQPNEISKAVLFLASDETASYLTGECITIDGGII